MRHVLIRHASSPCDAVTRLEVEVVREGPGLLRLRYGLTGDLDRLVIPPPAAPERVDGLWNQACFEAFVGGNGDDYAEFNFAPSSQWAAYRFDGYRVGMAPLPIAPPRIATTRSGGTLEVRASLPAHAGSRLGLAAVVEEVGGRLSYWALAHPPGDPDFHHAAGRAIAAPA